MNSFSLVKYVLAGSVAISGGFVAGPAHANTQQQPSYGTLDHRTDKELQDSEALTARAASEIGASYYTEIEYQPGSKQLNASSKKKIDELFARAQEAGRVKNVTVLSWSDEEYPARSQSLPAAQRELAEDRNRAVDDYLNSVRRIEVESYNMAEQPSAIEKFFNTTDTQLKQSLIAGGLPTTASDRQYPSKASRSVILVTTE